MHARVGTGITLLARVVLGWSNFLHTHTMDLFLSSGMCWGDTGDIWETQFHFTEFSFYGPSIFGQAKFIYPPLSAILCTVYTLHAPAATGRQLQIEWRRRQKTLQKCYRQTNRQTDKQTDRGVYRVAPQLKIPQRNMWATVVERKLGGPSDEQSLLTTRWRIFNSFQYFTYCKTFVSFKPLNVFSLSFRWGFGPFRLLKTISVDQS